MAVPTHSWFGLTAGSTTSAALPFPASGAGVDAGDAVMLYVCSAASSGTGEPPTPATPSGCTLIYSAWGGTGTAAVGTGPRKITIFRRNADATAAETGTIAVANPASSSFVFGFLYGIGKTPGAVLSFAGAFGSETTSGTAYSEVLDNDPGITTNDYLDHCVASPVAAGGWSAQAFSVPSVTVGTITERTDASTTSGHDARISHATGPVTAGASTGAATMTITRSTASTGVLVLLRCRETASYVRRRGPNYRR